jgi:hypothetical protein
MRVKGASLRVRKYQADGDLHRMELAMKSRHMTCSALLALMVCGIPVVALGQIDAQKARRCAMLAGTADYYLTRRGEGSGGPNMIILGARLDCEKGVYDRGIRTLEKLLLDKRIPIPPES